MDRLKEAYLKYKVCVVCNVPQSEAPNVMYAKFPKNINRCRKWIRIIGDVKLLQLSQKKIQYRYVCGKHFMRSQFTKSGKHLTKDAVPTILPPNNKPLKKDVVKLFPPLVTRSDSKVLLQCTQRIVPIKKEPEPLGQIEYLDEEYIESSDGEEEWLEESRHSSIEPNITIKEEWLDSTLREPKITIKEELLDPALKDCLPNIIPILHHNLPANSQTSEIYTINKDKQVIPITTKVLTDGNQCIIELSQKRMPIVSREPKVIPVSNEVLSSILKKDSNVTIEAIGYSTRDRLVNSPILTVRKEERLKRRIQSLQRRNLQLKRMLKNVAILEEIESPNIKRVIKKAIISRQLNVGINEFTTDKRLAASILKRALKAYQYLSCLIPLPNVCTLEKISMKDPIRGNTTKCRHLL